MEVLKGFKDKLGLDRNLKSNCVKAGPWESPVFTTMLVIDKFFTRNYLKFSNMSDSKTEDLFLLKFWLSTPWGHKQSLGVKYMRGAILLIIFLFLLHNFFTMFIYPRERPVRPASLSLFKMQEMYCTETPWCCKNYCLPKASSAPCQQPKPSHGRFSWDSCNWTGR